jgi:hypothetical protein
VLGVAKITGELRHSGPCLFACPAREVGPRLEECGLLPGERLPRTSRLPSGTLPFVAHRLKLSVSRGCRRIQYLMVDGPAMPAARCRNAPRGRMAAAVLARMREYPG